jgi:hypothetical protein
MLGQACRHTRQRRGGALGILVPLFALIAAWNGAEALAASDLGATIDQVGQRIDREAAPLPGLPATRDLTITRQGEVALLSRPCEPKPGCADPPTADVIVAFPPGQINTASIGYQVAPGGYAVLFTCTTIAPCIVSPDRRLQFRGYGLPCAGQAACNELVIAFTRLLVEASTGASAERKSAALDPAEPTAEGDTPRPAQEETKVQPAQDDAPADAPKRKPAVERTGCAGEACAEVEIKGNEQCSWAWYRGSRSARAEFRIGEETITHRLEPPDAEKARQRAAEIAAEDEAATRYARQKAKWAKFDAMVEQLR